MVVVLYFSASVTSVRCTLESGEMRIKRETVLRVAIATGVGLLVFAVTLLATWQGNGRHLVYLDELFSQPEVRLDVLRVGSAVESYREQRGSLPATLDALQDLPQAEGFFDDEGNIYPGSWGHPLVYSTDGEHFRLISYGRDGKPGGRGSDADLTYDAPDPPEGMPTIKQFLFELCTPGMFRTGVFAGLLAAVLCIVITRPVATRSWMATVLSLVATVASTAIIGAILAALHVPSGH